MAVKKKQKVVAPRKRYRVTDKSLGVTLMGSFGAIVLTDKLTQAKLKEIYQSGSKAVVYE